MTLEEIDPSEAVELYLEERVDELSERSLYGHKSRLRHFLRWCEESGIENLNTVSGRDIHRFRNWRREDGDLAPISVKTVMDTVRVFMRFCGTIEAVPPDLHTKVLSPSMSAEESARDEMVDAEVAKEILEYLESYEYASVRHVTMMLAWRALMRRGSIRALDLRDYDDTEMSLKVVHRPAQGTPLKNAEGGERFIALTPETCRVLDDWISDRRPDVRDSHGRRPLIASSQGRVHGTTLQNYAYSVTTPCLISDHCPHGEVINECDAANVRTGASKCPSSKSPHCIRRGAITHWLSEDVPEPVISSRANVSPEVLDRHYDRRSERQKMEQRRKYLERI